MALTISDTPLFLVGSVQPQIMMDISKDQQLYKKAFNDYSDLNGDGQIETTYTHSIDYYGYFDPGKCYTYSTTNNRFEPASVSSTKYCTGKWSGNFLNWATMTRMDAVRKLLYGGKRSTDSATDTTLERAYLPTDAHSFAKYYNGSDIAQLTPFTPPIAAAIVTSLGGTKSSANVNFPTTLPAAVTFTLPSTTAFANGDQVIIRNPDHPTTNYMIGAVSCVNGTGMTMYDSLLTSSASSCSSGQIRVVVEQKFGSATRKDWNIENWTQTGLTICNTTLGGSSGANLVSQTNTNPPLMRVAQGNFGLWAGNERWQCMWRDESSSPNEDTSSLAGSTRTNGNRAAHTAGLYSGAWPPSALYASSLGPNRTASGSGRVANALSVSGLPSAGDFNVRVQACVSSLLGNEKCKRYPSGNYKPIGLLQVYGDSDQINFGLMTGSYRKNISGGVVRKNLGTFTNEVNKDSDGTFTSTVGIVKTLDRMRIYGYYYGDGTYLGSNGDNCNWQLTDITEGNCTSWGNPMSEIYYESLNYLAGKTATAAYTYSGTNPDQTLGLPAPSWTSPLGSANYCAPLNALVFNASVSTNDFDLAGATVLNSGSTAANLANQVGTGEGIAGGSYFVGKNGTNNDELCGAKTVPNLGSIAGICPEGPTLSGSYLMPGMAYYAHQNIIRTDLAVPSADTKSLKVQTYGVQLATNVARVPVSLTGDKAPRVYLQPIYRLFNSPPQGGGTIVDMKIVSQTASATTSSGTLYLDWEDSEQGGDYDQDEWGVLSYCLTTVANGCGTGTAANTITVTTNTLAYSTNNPQGFGYVISGTTKDGPHFHSGILGFNYTDPTGVLDCNNCNVGDPATSVSYTLGTSTAQPLQDPLYYAAKWGSFTDSYPRGALDGKPFNSLEWDILNMDGTPGSDGIPDNYFLVSNPQGLEIAMNAAFLKILRDASASAVATNSSTLNASSRIFQARLSTATWSGQLLSYPLDTSGNLLSATSPPPAWNTFDTPYPEWDAGQQINTQAGVSTDSRLILTRNTTSGVGVEFRWGNLSTVTGGQQATLNKDWLLNTDNCGLERVAYLRGQSQNQGTGTFTCATAPNNTIQKFRVRNVSILGDIVNSSPAFVGMPQAGYSDVDNQGYSTFSASFKNRTPVVYVGANDGMLHGFDVSVDSATNLPTANAGKEILAYVPTPVYANLSRLTDSNYTASHKYYVDSSPMVGDACLSSCTNSSAAWETVLVGGLGAGGRGYYALNVTNPADASHNSSNTPQFNAANAANIVLWEFTSPDDADVGYTYNASPVRLDNGQAKQIVKFENGRWGVAVGNGYTSPSGKAVLYVLFLSGPTGSGKTWQVGVDYVKIVADAGPNNGLSTPMPFDVDGDGLADTVYAGDLNGNLWKFNLSNASPASWGLAYKLFAAGTLQPITTAPEVAIAPSGGLMVLFGTGKYLETADSTSTSVQTFYAIQDNTGATLAKSALRPVSITTKTASGTSFRTTSPGCGDSPLPACPTNPKGWYADLPTSRERATGAPQLVSGTIFFNTFVPSSTPCDFGGTGWLMGMDYTGGVTRPFGVFPNASGTPTAGVLVGAAIGGTTLIKSLSSSIGKGGGQEGNQTGQIIKSPSTSGTGVSSLPTANTVTTTLNFGPGSRGRLSWREILQ